MGAVLHHDGRYWVATDEDTGLRVFDSSKGGALEVLRQALELRAEFGPDIGRGGVLRRVVIDGRLRELPPELCWCCERDVGWMWGSGGGQSRYFTCKGCGADSRRG